LTIIVKFSEVHKAKEGAHIGSESEIHWLIPVENMTEGRFKEAIKRLSEESWFVPPESVETDPSSRLFTPDRKVNTRACRMYIDLNAEYRNEEGRNSYPGTPIPEGIGVLSAFIGVGTFGTEDTDEVCAAELMRVVFEEMGALFANLGDELGYAEAVRFSQYLKVMQGFVIFSKELAEAVGMDRLRQVGQVMDFDGGVQLVMSGGWTDHDPGISRINDVYDAFYRVIDEMIEKVPVFNIDHLYPPRNCPECGWEYEGSPPMCNECGKNFEE
jgi:hypothetical protein